MPSIRPLRFLPLLSLLALGGHSRADSASGLAIYSQTTPTFSRGSNTTGAPLSFTKSGPYGGASIAISLGLLQADVDSSGDFLGSADVRAGGTWHEFYQIDGTPAQVGTFGTANFTFNLSGTFTATNVGVGSGQSVNYSVSLPIQGSTAVSGEFSQNTFSGSVPPQTFTASFDFTYGSPFDVAVSLDTMSYTGACGLPEGASGHIHLTLQNNGFTVAGGGAYTGNSASGAAAGETLAPGASYAGFHLTNSVGHHTTATLLGGATGGARDVSLNFINAAGAAGLVSDVLDASGLNGDKYVLQLQYDEAAAIAQFGSESNLMLAWLNPATGLWQNAVDGNTGGAPTHIVGAYDPATNFVLGEWGVDPASNTVWAVVDHNSEFGVSNFTAAPDPASLAMLSLGGMMLGLRRRRSAR